MVHVIPGARYESGLGGGVTGGEAIGIEQTLKRKEIVLSLIQNYSHHGV